MFSPSLSIGATRTIVAAARDDGSSGHGGRSRRVTVGGAAVLAAADAMESNHTKPGWSGGTAPVSSAATHLADDPGNRAAMISG
jgi:hypothetical protein